MQKVEFTEIYYNLLTRILILRIYFDSQNWETLEYNLETFRIYLLRTKQLEENRRRSGLNLIRFTKSLQKLVEEKMFLRGEDFRKKRDQLKRQIEENKMVLNRSWLLFKLEKI